MDKKAPFSYPDLYIVVPHIVEACPDLDEWALLDLVREKSGRDYLDAESVQTIRALYYRSRSEIERGGSGVSTIDSKPEQRQLEV